MYKNGIGTEPNLDLYRLYMRMAADQGSRDAGALVTRWDRRNRKRQQDDIPSVGPENAPGRRGDAEPDDPEEQDRSVACAVSRRTWVLRGTVP